MKKILIADDTRQILDLMHIWLTDEGYAVLRVPSLSELRKFYRPDRYDLVILDDLEGGGVAFGEQLFARGQKVLITSAFTGNDPNVPRVTKPFISKAQFVFTVRTLAGHPNSA